MKIRLLITVLLFSVYGLAQRENNIWYFGDRAGLDFNSGNPVNLNDGALVTIEGCATISNVSGQLLFYTDGKKVWDKNHHIMPNGDNLKGHSSSTQSAIIVPKPNSNTIYYIFTTSQVADIDGICYSEVDITLNGGLGDVNAVKNVQLYSPTCEKICAVKNFADNSYWVVTHGFENNSFLAFKVDSSGVHMSPVVSNVGSYVGAVPPFNFYNVQGYLKFSPSGSKLVCVNTYLTVELFDFDTQTGLIRSPVVVNAANLGRYCYGAEFSPSGNFLYLTGGNTPTSINKIFQYNLQAANIGASEVQINTTNIRDVGALQLASNCKIYAANAFRGFGNYLHVIENPDIPGMGCGFQRNNVALTGLSWIGLPQFIEYSTCKNRTIINDDICIGGNASFSLGGDESITSANWNFGDGSTSNSIIGFHQYTAAGTYIVTGDFATPTANFRISKQITVPENPIANPISDLIFCGATTASYDLSQLTSRVLGNQSGSIYGVSFFASQNDALTHQNLLAPVQNFTAPGTTIYVKVYRFSNFDCYAITSFKVLFNPYPILNPVSEFKLCDDGQVNDGYVEFDLSTKTPEILGSQSSNDVKVSYHLTLTEAQNNVNPITAPFTNTINPQTIYARLSTLPSQTCYVTTSFNLNVKPSPEFDIRPFYVLCEDGNFENYVNVQVPDIFSYYLWSTGSQANFTNIAITGNFWVKVTKIQSRLRCSRTKNFQVIAANKAIIKEIVIQDWSANANSIQILLDTASLGEYEYSIDGYNYQNANYFEGLLPGKYTVYVREKNGCGITTDELYLLMYPKFFTPNDDGYNDVWQVKFAETETYFSVRIFDRYGRILSATNTWDGTYQGKPMPADDYWFIVERENGKQYKGHFALKR
ncbi:T9SS type B sorting domain-containing protein [Flavobacterium sp. CYK-4]|uniref:T9SS type B sorting domain-containing protein n=1 Tax=Flavobacterium lotistagni TaxID=2709660 RepID=UPI0014086078|nr:T9SS type B sorting domain-containing protein [Flavobacterium lotistagni]NHM07577.1 T9SS type B sorting domain-containing protein [Flavobacterium lotistagni]